jgi:hypothetical protein
VIWKISVGRNWARWVALMSVILGTLIALPTLGQSFAKSPTATALAAVSTAADVVALYLLFVSPGRRWFSRPPV